MLGIVLVAIRHSRLDRLRRRTNLALHSLLDALRRLLSLLRRGGRSLAQNFLRAIHDIFSLVLALVGISLVFAIFLDECNKVFDRARAAVEDRRVFAAGGEEFDCGEALDLVGDVIGRSVDFGDGYFGG